MFYSLGYALDELLYEGEKRRVWKGKDVNTQEYVTITLYEGLNETACQSLRQGFECQGKVTGHVNVVSLKMYNWDCQASYAVYHIEEYMDKSLQRDIEFQISGNAPINYRVAWNIVQDLVKEFAEMQGMQIVHRNITLQTLKCLNQKAKIGDFRYALNTFNAGPYEVKYDLDYCSPESASQIETYEPYKADVFALGLCFLGYFLRDTRELKGKAEYPIQTFQYIPDPGVRSVLYWMLQWQPENRPDFQTLNMYLGSQCSLPGLCCPHIGLNSEYVYFTCHGNFCYQYCATVNAQDSQYYCPICGSIPFSIPVTAVHPQPQVVTTIEDTVTSIDNSQHPLKPTDPQPANPHLPYQLLPEQGQALGTAEERGLVPERREEPLIQPKKPEKKSRWKKICCCFK